LTRAATPVGARQLQTGARRANARDSVAAMRTTSARFPGLALTDHEFQVPLDHAEPAGTQITVFAQRRLPARRR